MTKSTKPGATLEEHEQVVEWERSFWDLGRQRAHLASLRSFASFAGLGTFQQLLEVTPITARAWKNQLASGDAAGEVGRVASIYSFLWARGFIDESPFEADWVLVLTGKTGKSGRGLSETGRVDPTYVVARCCSFEFAAGFCRELEVLLSATDSLESYIRGMERALSSDCRLLETDVGLAPRAAFLVEQIEAGDQGRWRVEEFESDIRSAALGDTAEAELLELCDAVCDGTERRLERTKALLAFMADELMRIVEDCRRAAA